jgi:glutamyl-tRNA reductase
MDPAAGFAALETCNRVEWIATTENPQWVAELLSAQIEQRWQAQLPHLDYHPQPRVFIGREAARHLLRVVAGLESLAAGEAQIAGQFQDALLRARDERMSSPVLNRLAGHAGRLAKAGLRIGYRSDHRRGIHGMTSRLLQGLFNGSTQRKTILVVGMGAIGRKTAEALEQDLAAEVIRLNRTIGEQHRGVAPLGDRRADPRRRGGGGDRRLSAGAGPRAIRGRQALPPAGCDGHRHSEPGGA